MANTNVMKKAAAVLTILILTGMAGKLVACSCMGQRTVQEEIKYADAVLVGTIISNGSVNLVDSTILQMFPNDTARMNAPMNKFTIARYGLLVQDIYKGKITQDTVTIYTGMGGGDCGIRFTVGDSYIVYGKNETYFGQTDGYKFPKGKNIYWTYSCLRTTSFYQEELNEIEKYAKPLKDWNVLILTETDSPPVFKEGGDPGLKKFIQDNLRYPVTEDCITGQVYVGFTVDTLGNVKDIEIKKGIMPSTDEEAIRIVKMLTFTPGISNGRPVDTKMYLPIRFTIAVKDEK